MENNFDKYFKDKFENREFEMKPEFWEGAEALIEADERSGRRGMYMWIFGIAFLVGIGGFFIWKSTNSTTISMVEENPNFINEKALLPNSKEDAKEMSSNDLIKETAENKEEIIKNDNSYDSNNSSETVIGNTSETIVVPKEKNKTQKTEFGNDFSSPKNPFSQSIPKTNNSILQTNEVKKDRGNQGTNQDQYLNQNLDLNSSSNKSNTTDGLLPIVKKSVESELDKEGENVKLESEILNTKDKKEEPKVASKKQTATFISPLNIFLLPKKEKDFELDTACFPYVKDTWTLGGTLGAVGYPLIENSSTRPFIGFKGGFLLEYNLATNPKRDRWSIGTELLYHYRSGNFVATKEEAVVQYSFGSTSTTAQLTPKNLHYLEMPIYLKYHLPRISFEAGGLVSYLLGVRGDVNQNNEIETGWVTETGFRKIHTNAILGAQFRLTSNLRFGVRANYSLNSILDKNAVLPNGEALRESGPLYLTFKVSRNF